MLGDLININNLSHIGKIVKPLNWYQLTQKINQRGLHRK